MEFSMKILRAFLLTIGVFSSTAAYGSVEGKIYVPAEKIALEDHVIWVQIDNQWRQVDSLATDSNGIYVRTDAALSFWECSRCGNINPPWNFLACGRCGNPR